MNILLCAPNSGASGGILRWTEHLWEYYENLDNKKFGLNILDTGLSIKRRTNPSITYRIVTGIKEHTRIYKKFCRCIHKQHYDVVHLTSSASISLVKDLIMLRKAKKKGLQTILHFHFGRIPELQKQDNWEWKLLVKNAKLADKIIVIDQTSYTSLCQYGFKNVVNIPNPLAPKVETIIQKKQSQYTRIENTLLFVGHVVRTKGVYELVDACKNISGIKLKMIGPVQPEVKSELLSSAHIAGQNTWLEILGDRPYSDVLSEMLQCEIFVLPTHTEGFPNVILESMACGCPIIASSVGAIPEMLQGNSACPSGILIPAQNTETLRKSIIKLLKDRRLRGDIGQNAKKRVTATYNMRVIWSQLYETWSSLT